MLGFALTTIVSGLLLTFGVNQMEAITEFARRTNPNHTIDSICTNCYLTVATAEDELLLQIAESTHQCHKKDTWYHYGGRAS